MRQKTTKNLVVSYRPGDVFLPASALRPILPKAKHPPLSCAVHEGQRLKQMTTERFRKEATHDGNTIFPNDFKEASGGQ